METLKKPSQIRIRISEDDARTMSDLTDDVLSVTDIATYVLHGAILAIRENGGKVELPPRFTVLEQRLKCSLNHLDTPPSPTSGAN